MANLFTLGFGKVSDFMGKLAEAGLTAEMAEGVRKNPALAEIIVSALKQQPAFTLVHGLFIKPEAQIARINELRQERGWGIPDAWLTEAEKSVPKWPENKLVVATLVPYLDDVKNGPKGVERTFHELWGVASSAQHAKWRWDGYDKAGPERLRLLKGIEYKPGLRWEVIDLGCQRDKKPEDVCHPEKSPHAGILASAALHPEWIKAMDGENVPYVWASGYEVNVPNERPWACVPYLDFDRGDRKIELSYKWSVDYDSSWAVPSFVRE
jgi:hypothetical protein